MVTLLPPGPACPAGWAGCRAGTGPAQRPGSCYGTGSWQQGHGAWPVAQSGVGACAQPQHRAPGAALAVRGSRGAQGRAGQVAELAGQAVLANVGPGQAPPQVQDGQLLRPPSRRHPVRQSQEAASNPSDQQARHRRHPAPGPRTPSRDCAQDTGWTETRGPDASSHPQGHHRPARSWPVRSPCRSMSADTAARSGRRNTRTGMAAQAEWPTAPVGAVGRDLQGDH